MEQKSLINGFELAFSPVSNYDFTFLRDEEKLQNLLANSSLYIIAQRTELSFESFTTDPENGLLEFEIHQKHNPKKLKCKLHISQIASSVNSEIDICIEFASYNSKIDKSADQKVNNIHSIRLFASEISRENFLVWFSPEKFLHNYWKKCFDAEIIGDIMDFLKYKVHYVGKSTDQDIWVRLTGHNTLQDILSIEYPLVHGSLPTHEIVLLLYKFQDNVSMSTFDNNSSINDMVNALYGKDRPDQRSIFLDDEKVLIKYMQPIYYFGN